MASLVTRCYSLSCRAMIMEFIYNLLLSIVLQKRSHIVAIIFPMVVSNQCRDVNSHVAILFADCCTQFV